MTSAQCKLLWLFLCVCCECVSIYIHLPIELTLVGGPPMLEGATLCFMEVGSSLFAAAAAAGTCGEVGGELGDLLSDALGLADRFSGCAPSLSCKNQNSTVSPAVTTEGIWKREARGPPSPSPHRDHFQWRCANRTGAHAQQSEASPGGTNHKVHATAPFQTARNKREDKT